MYQSKLTQFGDNCVVTNHSFRPCIDSVFWYYTFGAAFAEVEIDCLTGEHHVCKK